MGYTLTRIKFRPLNLIAGFALLLLFTGNIYAKRIASSTKLNPEKISALLITPTITFSSALSSRQYGSNDFTPATSTSNAALTFSSDNPAVATIVNNKVHVTGVGTATITATQPANSQYEAATSSATLTVIKASPVITFVSTFSPRIYNATLFTPATANLKATIILSSDNPAVATIVNNQVKMQGAGTANITATINDDDNYNGTTLSMPLTIEKAEPVITFINNFSPRPYRATDFTAATSTLGATITYTSDNPAVATVVNGKINMVSVGTANITATIADDNRYVGTTITQELVVEKATPVITFVNNFSPKVYSAADFIAATANLGAPITFSSDNPAVATIVNNQVNMIGAGTANIIATIADDNRYNGTTLTMPLTVVKAEPVVTFINNLSPRVYTTNDFTPATVTLGAPLVLTTDNPAVATIVNGKLNMLAPGTVNITASVTGNDKYVGTSVTSSLTVLKASPTITFVSNFSPRAYSATAFTPATANYGAPVTFTSDNPAVATIVNNQVKMVNPGTANITATIAESDQYEGKEVAMPLVVEKVSANINFISGLGAKPYSTIDFIPATATSNAPLTFTSDNPSVATIMNNQVHLVGVGTANITATIPDNARYVGKTATVAMTVIQSTPVITFATLNPRSFNTSDFTPATVTLGAPVTFTSDNPAVATIVNGKVNMIAVGTANITATVEDNDKYVGVTATATLNVVKSTPVITFVSNFSPRRYGSGNFIPASANYGAAIIYTSDNPAVAQIENNQVKLVSIGTANITASVADNDVYNAASLTRELNVTQATQTISFATITNKTYASPPFLLSASSTSGLPVTFTSSNDSIASITGKTVVITGIGTVSITASQAGNANYGAAQNVVRTFTVSKVPQTINFATLIAKNYGDTPFTLTGNTTSGLPITYVSSDPQVATVNGNTVTIMGGGTTEITASQEGTDAYAAATPVTRTLTVNKIDQTITFEALTNLTYGDEPYTLNATASSGLPVIFTSSDTTIAKINGNKVTVLSGGPVEITASQPGNNNYNAASSITQSLNITKANQTITFAALPDKQYADPDFALTGTSSSSLPLIYTSSNPLVATVSGNIVTIVGVGNTTITATQPGNSNYNAAENVSRQLNVNKANQTIAFAALQAKSYADPNFALTASVSSGLPITYSSSNPLVATVTDNVITIVGIGSAIITASQPGNENYNAAADVTQTLNIGKANQTITFAALPGKTYNDAPFELTASSSSGLPVTYTSSNPLVATVTGNTVTIVGPGVTSITASQPGNENYNSAVSVPQTLNVAQSGQTIAFSPLPVKTYNDQPFYAHASSTSGLPVILTSSNTAVATVTDSTITIIGAGTAEITASQPGNANYAAASPVTRTLTVNKANQTIDFATLPTKTMGDAPFDLTATATSGLPVSYTSSNPSVATVSGNTVNITGAGATIITASQPGNANYNAAEVALQALSVGKADQSIVFTSLTDKVVGDNPFDLSATATSGLAVTYTSSNPAVASINGNTVTINGAGVAIITAFQSGNTSYNAAQNVYQLQTVNEGSQIITFASIPNKNVGDPSFNANASASSGLPLEYSSSDNAVATISNTGVITIIGQGTVTITASQPGNNNWLAATPANQTFTVDPVKQNQTITFASIGNKTVGDAPFTLSATATSTLPVTFSSSDPSIASISGNTVTIIKDGNVTITASQLGDATYNPATATQSFVISPASQPGKQNQSIIFASIGNKTVDDAPFTLSATATSTLPVTFSSSDPSIASISGNTVTIIKDGNVTITAYQAGNATYNSATAVQSFVISPASQPGKQNQSITFASIGNKTVGDAPFTLSATATSSLPVTFSSSDPSIASVNGNTVTIIKDGNVNITAYQAGDATFNPATVVQSFVISPASQPTKQNQTITFAPIGNKTVGDAPFTLNATATSTLPVTFSSSDPSIASISGNTVTIIKDGNVNITAYQAGDATFNPATAVRSFVISPASQPNKQNQTITFAPIGNKTVGDAPFTLSATATSTLPVTFSSSDPSIASISGNTVTIIKDGNVTITAYQAGNATFNPATAVQSFVISPASQPGKQNQTITFAGIPNKTVGDAPFTLSATATSTLPVTFSSSDPSIASVNGNTVTIFKDGNVTITAYQEGNATFNAATAVQSFVVSPASQPNKQNQTITFAPIGNKTVGDAPFTLSATATSTLPVTFSSSDPSIASVNGNTVTVIKDGNVTITAYQAGDATYNSATAAQSFVISPTSQPGKQNQSITFSGIPNKTVGDAPFTLSATATSTLPVTFSSSDPSIASVNGNTVTIIKDGNVTITAYQAGNATYNSATAVQSFVISPASQPNKQNQTITFAPIGNKTVGDAPFTLNATATSTLPITFSSSDPGIASISGNTLTIIKDGNVTITAYQAGNATFNPATAVQSFVISPASQPNKQNQTITFAPIGNKTVGDAPFTLNATATSTLPVTFSSSDPSIASVNGNTVTIIKDGNVTITAYQGGNATFNAATAVQSFVVNTITSVTKTNQSITFATIGDKLTTDAPFNAGATASSGLDVIYSSSNNNVATVSATGLITITGAGNVTITASQPGNATFNPAASVPRSFTVSAPKLDQTITFNTITGKTYGNTAFQLAATASSGLTITYTSSNTDVATISGNTVTIKAAGNAIITASQSGNATYNAAPVATQILVANKATLMVQATDASRVYGTVNPTFVMSYSGFVNGDNQTSLTVTPAVSTSATVTSLPGTYALVPLGGVSNNYAFVYTNGTFTITPALAIITFNALPAKTYGDADFTPGATSSVGEPVQYTSSNTAVATIVNGNIHITGAGTSIITALYPPTSGYNLTQPQTQLLVVNKAQQTISFAAIPPIVKGETYSLQNVTASSGLPVNFTITDQNIVTLQGTTLTARQLGGTTINANQPGNNNYLPATAVTRPVEVVNILGKPEIEIHKAVSPNGDGINDFLFIEGINKFPTHMITVYNRNGIKVWETTHYDNTSTRFEGRSNINGQLQAGGTYFYVIQFMNNGVGRRIEGTFVLKYQ